MNWNAIGAVAEIAGVLAVIVSVLYLAKQVKIGNDLNRTNTFRSIFQGMAAYSTEMFSPENAELMVKGYTDFESLPPVEKLRFENLLAHLFNYAEDSYDSAQVGLLGHDTIDNWSWYMRTRLFPYQGVKHWWTTYREGYAPDFRKWVDDAVQDSSSSDDAYGIIDPSNNAALVGESDKESK